MQQASGDVAVEVAKAQGDAARGFESAVDSFGGSVRADRLHTVEPMPVGDQGFLALG